MRLQAYFGPARPARDRKTADRRVHQRLVPHRLEADSRIPGTELYPGAEVEHWDRSATRPVFDPARMPRWRKGPQQQRGSRLDFANSFFHLLRDDDSVARLQFDILVWIVTLQNLTVVEGHLNMLAVDQPHHMDFFHICKSRESSGARQRLQYGHARN